VRASQQRDLWSGDSDGRTNINDDFLRPSSQQRDPWSANDTDGRPAKYKDTLEPSARERNTSTSCASGSASADAWGKKAPPGPSTNPVGAQEEHESIKHTSIEATSSWSWGKSQAQQEHQSSENADVNRVGTEQQQQQQNNKSAPATSGSRKRFSWDDPDSSEEHMPTHKVTSWGREGDDQYNIATTTTWSDEGCAGSNSKLPTWTDEGCNPKHELSQENPRTYEGAWKGKGKGGKGGKGKGFKGFKGKGKWKGKGGSRTPTA